MGCSRIIYRLPEIIVGPGVWDVPETDAMMMIDDVFRWNGMDYTMDGFIRTRSDRLTCGFTEAAYLHSTIA